MKAKKGLALSLSLLMLGSVCGSVAGCGGSTTKGVVEGDKVVNVMPLSKGYGIGWLQEVAEAFNKLYKAEGYEVNILDGRSDYEGRTALAEMRMGTVTGVDLHLTSMVYVDDVLNEEYGVCAENLDDLYASKPINFDGSEGSATLAELANDSEEWNITDSNGSYWSYSYSSSVRGLVVNTKVLAKYGITETPRTTDELFEAYNAIYYGANGQDGTAGTGVSATTWGGENSTYSINSLYLHLAQLMGVDAYHEFFLMDNVLQDLETLENGYKIYTDNEYIQDVLEVYIQQYDTAYSVRGSVSQKHTLAHGQIMQGRAAFMTDGEFFYNEVRANYSKYLNDIAFVNTPVISALGTNLKLDGTGTDKAKCDDILSYMIKLIDEGKKETEVKSATEAQFSIALTEEQVARVMEARCIGFGGSITPGGYITKGTRKADIAKLFLRMLASQDAANVYTKYGMMTSYEKASADGFANEFSKGAVNVVSLAKYYCGTPQRPGSIRQQTNLFLMPSFTAYMANEIAEDVGATQDVSTRNYAALAGTAFSQIKKDVTNNWSAYMARAGKYDGSKYVL